MKGVLKIIAALLLVFNGIGAVYGGLHLMLHPDGSSIGLDLHYLDTSPFNNYFIPGLILFLANGVFSFVIFILLLLRNSATPLLIMTQGCVLMGWIIVQVLMVQSVYYLHYVMGGTGVVLFLAGWMLTRRTESRK